MKALIALLLFTQLTLAADTDNDGFSNIYDADFNNDGIVNFSDLAEFRLIFGSGNAVADLTGDGLVNFADLARFRALFGKPPGGAAMLTWEAPTLNEDDSPLTDLAGYHVYSSLNEAVVQSVPIEVYGTELVIDNLASGEWFFAVTAVNDAGTESVFSNVGSKAIQ